MHRLLPLLAAIAVLAASAFPLALPGAAQEGTAQAVGGITLSPGLKFLLGRLAYIDGPRIREGGLDGKVVVVSFFASWCPPCRVEFEQLKQLHAAYAGRGLAVVVLNLFEDWDGDGGVRLVRYLAAQDSPFAVVKGSEIAAAAFGNVRRIPTLFIFGRDGRQATHFVHQPGATKTHLGLAELHAAIQLLL